MDELVLETIELEMAILLRHITSIASNKNECSLDRSAYLLLHQISAHGSAGVRALAEEFHLDASTISRQVAALEQKEYVFRVPDPLDGRACSFQITDLGAKELVEYKQWRLARVKKKLADWSDEECQYFGQLLRKFNHSF